MDNIKVFENDLPDIDLSEEKRISLDCEALGLVLGRAPLTLIQLGLESKKFFIIKLNRICSSRRRYESCTIMQTFCSFI